MHSNSSNGSRGAQARGFAALCAIVLAMGLALAASPAEAAPFAYVSNSGDGTVSVIDANPPSVVATVPVGPGPFAVAVTPDGKHAYVTNALSNNVSVIDTATNSVGATVPVGVEPVGVAVTPDGKHAYVANRVSNDVSVIDHRGGHGPGRTYPPGSRRHPDGKHAYVTNYGSNNVSVIDTASNTVGTTVPVGITPLRSPSHRTGNTPMSRMSSHSTPPFR